MSAEDVKVSVRPRPARVDARRPRKGWYFLAVLPPAIAVILAVTYWVVSMQQFEDTVDGFHRFGSPGELTQTFDQGSVHIYVEPDSARWGTGADAPTRPQLEVFSPSGSPVAVRPYMQLPVTSTNWTYDIGGQRGIGIAAFDVAQTGEYRVVAFGGDGLVLALGEGVGQQGEKITFNAVGYAFLGLLAGGIVSGSIALMRRRSVHWSRR